MAEIVTNLVSPDPADINTWLSATIGGADAGIPVVNVGSFPGIDGTQNCQQLSNGSNALVAGDHYAAWTANFAASATYDMSAVDSAFFIHFRNNSPSYYTIASTADAIWFTLYSGGSSANWRRWNFGGTTEFYNGSWHLLTAISDGTPDATGGTWDETDVTGAGIMLESNTTGGNFGFQISIDQMIFVNGPAIFGDTGGVTLTDQSSFYELLKATSGTAYHSDLVQQAGPAVEYGFPFRIEAANFNSPNDAEISAFKEADGLGYPVMPSGYFQAALAPPVGGTQVYENYTCATNSTKYDLTIDASSSGCALSLLISSFAGVNDAVIGGANLIMEGTVASPATISIADGDLTLVVDSPAAPVVWGADLVAGSVLTIKTPVADALTINFDATDLSDIIVTLPTSTVNVAPTTTDLVYDLSGFQSVGTVTFDNLVATTADTTVKISSSGITGVVASPLSGTGALVLDNAVTVTVAVTVQDTSLAAISGAVVYIEAATGGPLPYRESVSITRSGSTATVTHTAHGRTTGDEIKFRDCTESEYNIAAVITVVDPNTYTYSVAGTPTTPATGTPTATSVILNGTTNGSGLIEDTTFTFTSTQPISGTSRKATGSPLYKPSPIGGEITAAGLNSTILLVDDE